MKKIIIIILLLSIVTVFLVIKLSNEEPLPEQKITLAGEVQSVKIQNPVESKDVESTILKDETTETAETIKENKSSSLEEQLNNYLKFQNRNAESLILAYLKTKNLDYLDEAFEKFPNEPFVLLQWAIYNPDIKNRIEVLQHIHELTPNDAMALYLLADQLFSDGKTLEAQKMLMKASLMPQSNNFSDEIILAERDYHLFHGDSESVALTKSMSNLVNPTASNMMNIKKHLEKIVAAFDSQKDHSSLESIALLGARIGYQMRSQMNHYILDNLVALSVERDFLTLLSPEIQLSLDGPTAMQRLEEIEAYQKAYKERTFYMEDIVKLSEQQRILYLEDVLISGELEAALRVEQKLQSGEWKLN